MSSRGIVERLFTLCDHKSRWWEVNAVEQTKENETVTSVCKGDPASNSPKVRDVLEESSADTLQMLRGMEVGGGLWLLQHKDRSPCIGALLYYRPTPVQVKSWCGTSMCKFSSPLPLAQGQPHKMGLIGIMGALAAWLLLKDECLIYVSVILTPAWLNWFTRAIVCQGLAFQKSGYRWCFCVTDF